MKRCTAVISTLSHLPLETLRNMGLPTDDSGSIQVRRVMVVDPADYEAPEIDECIIGTEGWILDGTPARDSFFYGVPSPGLMCSDEEYTTWLAGRDKAYEEFISKAVKDIVRKVTRFDVPLYVHQVWYHC